VVWADAGRVDGLILHSPRRGMVELIPVAPEVFQSDMARQLIIM
jgi:hypothetical protein